MQNQIRKVLSMLSVLMVMMLVLSACSGGKDNGAATGGNASGGNASGGTPAKGEPGPNDEAKLYELAKQEGTVVWYDSAPLEPMKEVAKDFEQKYPGVKVEVLRIVGVQQYQKYLQEVQAKQNIVDVLFISDYPSMVSLKDMGHLVEWKVPTADRIPEQFRIGNYSYSPYTTDIAIVYNTKKVTPEEVKILSNWKGILDPRFKGRFAVASQKCGACYAGVHMFLDPKLEKEFGPEFIKKIGEQKPKVYSEVLVGLDRVIAGEQDFTFWTWEAIALTNQQNGAPIRWIHPDPTPEWGNSWHAISKYAPHPNAARLFENWMMSDEGAASLQKKYGSATTLEGVKDTRTIKNEPWYDPIKTRYNVDFQRWDKNYDKDMELWIKAVGG